MSDYLGHYTVMGISEFTKFLNNYLIQFSKVLKKLNL